MTQTTYQRNYNRIFKKKAPIRLPPEPIEDEFDIRWRQLRTSNSREHITTKIIKMTKKFSKWQKNV